MKKIQKAEGRSERLAEMKRQRHGLSQPSQGPWWDASLFVAGCMLIGFLGSYLGGAFKKQPWYDDSPKPRFWPPQWVFPTAWIGNYTFMGLALWQVWQQRQGATVAKPLAIFAIHLLHNFSFIPIVYQLKQKSVYVLMDTIGLCLGLVTTVAFARISQAAKWLMLPYLCWLFFTTSIKVFWWRMNLK